MTCATTSGRCVTTYEGDHAWFDAPLDAVEVAFEKADQTLLIIERFVLPTPEEPHEHQPVRGVLSHGSVVLLARRRQSDRRRETAILTFPIQDTGKPARSNVRGQRGCRLAAAPPGLRRARRPGTRQGRTSEAGTCSAGPAARQASLRLQRRADEGAGTAVAPGRGAEVGRTRAGRSADAEQRDPGRPREGRPGVLQPLRESGGAAGAEPVPVAVGLHAHGAARAGARHRTREPLGPPDVRQPRRLRVGDR